MESTVGLWGASDLAEGIWEELGLQPIDVKGGVCGSA